MSQARILLFADGSNNLGSGHLMRSLVLANELIELGSTVLVAGKNATQLGKTVKSLANVPTRDCVQVADTSEREAITAEFGPTLAIVDGYEFGDNFFHWLQSRDFPHGVIDDFGQTRSARPFFVLDQNPGSNPLEYRNRFPMANLFIGKDFSLIRREFLNSMKYQSRQRTESYVMVSFGGTDVLGLGREVSIALAESGLSVKLATGHPSLTNQGSSQTFAHPSNVSPVNQSDYENTLAGASCAVLAAGTSIWESLFLGIPTIGVVVAENQLRGAEYESENNPLLTLVDGRDNGELLDALRVLVHRALKDGKGRSLEVADSGIAHSARRAAEQILSLVTD